MKALHRIARFRRWLTRPETRVSLHIPHQWHGSDYGGWCICTTDLSNDSVVYSFGVGDDITFDLSLISSYSLHVHAFDPTPRSLEWIKHQQLPSKLHFYPYGLAAYDGLAPFRQPANPNHVSFSMEIQPDSNAELIQAPVRSLATILSELGHTKIDILKMDIEGAEYSALPTILNAQAEIRQILVEFHHRFKTFSWNDTKKAIRQLKQSGYAIFFASKTGTEFSFYNTKYLK